jgi:hypothetical protein
MTQAQRDIELVGGPFDGLHVSMPEPVPDQVVPFYAVTGHNVIYVMETDNKYFFTP